MNEQTKAAFADYWQDKDHTKSMLAALGASLNPPVELSTNDNTDEMVAEALRHCEEHGIELAVNAESGEWEQAVALTGTDTPTDAPTQSEQPRPEDPDQGEAGAALAQQESAKPKKATKHKAGAALDALDELLTLPPAHQNHLTPEARARSTKGRALVAEVREALGL